MQGKVEEDNLEDYNEDPEYANMGNAGQHPSHTPPQTPTILNNSDSEESDEDKDDSEEGQEIEMDTQSAQQALVEHRQKQFDILSTKLEENGWKFRLKVFADPLQSNLAMSMNASTRTLAEILQLVPLEDAEQISEFQGTVYMPLHFLEKHLLPSMQLRKLLETEDLIPGSQVLTVCVKDVQLLLVVELCNKHVLVPLSFICLVISLELLLEVR
jgi:hypothetical protein